ncbi:MAG: rod shape-determining protein MreC [Chlamydiae bacterium]|nr:rod shape-determining protein MreC [Chlamydiota bacterium]MBI3266585.1 rod shape-determining protein MreC [Chlamydiota bacterium]
MQYVERGRQSLTTQTRRNRRSQQKSDKKCGLVLFRKRILLYLALLSLVPLVFLGLPKAFVQHLRNSMNKISVSTLDLSEKSVQKLKNFWGSWGDVQPLRDENSILKNQIGLLKLEVDQLKSASSENERLLKILHFAEGSSWNLLPAHVIGRSPSHWNQSVWISVGENQRIREGMAVLSPDGVVGKIVEVMPQWSRVLLVTDENCKMGVVAERTHEMGILQGLGAKCVVNYLPREAELKSGDRILSSGLSRFFPAGLEIGKVIRVQDDAYGLFQYAEVSPSARFGKLEEVLVIVSKEKEYVEE